MSHTFHKDDVSLIQSALAKHGFDRPLLAGLAGVLATLISIAYNHLAKRLGLILWDLTQIGSAIMTRGKDTTGLDAFIGGTLQNCLIGAISGLVFYYSLILFGKKYIYLKCVVHALVFWMVTMTVYAYALGVPPIVFSKIKYNLVYNFEAALWGLIASAFLNVLVFNQVKVKSKRSIFRFSPVPARKHKLKQRKVHLVKPKKL